MPRQRGNAIEGLVDGAAGAFVTLAIMAVVVIAVFGVSEDLPFVDAENDTMFIEIQSVTEDGMVALGGIVLLLVIVIALGFLRRRGVI